MSEMLIFGYPDAEGAVVPVTPDKTIQNGGRVFKGVSSFDGLKT